MSQACENHGALPAKVRDTDIERVLDCLRSMENASVEAIWEALGRDHWPALFTLLDIGAGLPRLAGHETVRRMRAETWPRLLDTVADLVRVQRLVDRPIVPPGAQPVPTLRDAESAAEQLAEHRCVNLEGFLGAAGCAALEAAVEDQTLRWTGSWGDVTRDNASDLYAAMERGLGSAAFRRLSGFDLERHRFRLTLSLQSLETTGIGWHRDLYWPREWVGHDVFAVFHGLDEEASGAPRGERGGAFVYYLPWHNQVYAFYRKRHQTTVLWNAAHTERRILHAVSGYHGADTRRHLVIAQCLRGTGESPPASDATAPGTPEPGAGC